MPVVTSIDQFGFDEMIPRLASAKEITIVTHSFSVGRVGPLKAALSSRRSDSNLTIITCIPCCAMNFGHPDTATNSKQIADYYRALSPTNWSAKTEVWLSHRNHAKIVLCDHVAYVGSANFTTGSARNFEAGYVTDAPEDLRRLGAFIDQLKQRSIPYNRVGDSVLVQRLLQFAADTRWLIEAIITHNCEDEIIYKDVTRPRFVLDQFGLPARVVEIIRAAVNETKVIDLKAKLGRLEESIYDAGITVRMNEVREAMDSILGLEQIPKAISADQAAEELIEKYLYSEDPGSNPALLDEAQEIAEANEKQRYQIARQELRDFIRILVVVRREVFRAVGIR